MSSTTSAVSNLNTNAAYQVGDKGSGSSLDKNGFLKMLTEQMKNQDPTSGQDPNQYFQTISMMSQVEQLTNISAAQTATVSRQRDANATALIGKTVTYFDAKTKATATGTVQSVQLSDTTGPSLTVNGVAKVDPDSVTNIQ
jgi:flagellar basal-body rod modification protein FlgD